MPEMMAVLLDGVAQLEYDHAKQLPPHQELYLDKMDEKMDEGIDLDGEWIASPATGQRAQFVAANLAAALQNGDESMAAAMCTYLANRQPDLLQVKIENVEGGISIDLDYETAYKKQVAVDFKMH